MLTIGIGGGDETGLREYDKNKSLCAEDTGGKKNWILDQENTVFQNSFGAEEMGGKMK